MKEELEVGKKQGITSLDNNEEQGIAAKILEVKEIIKKKNNIRKKPEE